MQVVKPGGRSAEERGVEDSCAGRGGGGVGGRTGECRCENCNGPTQWSRAVHVKQNLLIGGTRSEGVMITGVFFFSFSPGVTCSGLVWSPSPCSVRSQPEQRLRGKRVESTE